MPYVRDWETLGEALQRLKDNGQDEGQAKRDLCNAVADRKIRVRAQCTSGGMHYDIEVPPRIEPLEMCWFTSRPLTNWRHRQRVVDRYFDADLSLEVCLIEVRRSDVDRLLLGRDDTPQDNAHSRTALGRGDFPAGGTDDSRIDQPPTQSAIPLPPDLSTVPMTPPQQERRPSQSIRRKPPGVRLVEALQRLRAKGDDIDSGHVDVVHKKALAEAEIGSGDYGSSRRTFERALGQVRSRK